MRDYTSYVKLPAERGDINMSANYRDVLFLLFTMQSLLSQTTYSQQVVWNQIGGPPGGAAYSVVSSSSGYVFAGSEHNGVFRSSDGGLHWVSTDSHPSRKRIRAMAIDPHGIVFAGTEGDGVFRSTDLGGSWIPSNSGLTNTNIFGLAIDSNGVVLAGTGNSDGALFRSSDHGSTWMRSDNGMPNYSDVMSITVDSRNRLFAANLGYGVFRSIDGGQTWHQMKSTIARSVAANFNDDLYLGTNQAIYKSTDGGISWAEVLNSGSPYRDVWSFAFDPRGHVFAAIWNAGIHISLDNGTTWNHSNIGLSDSSLLGVSYSSLGKVIAATYYEGLFCSSDSGCTWSSADGYTNSIVQSLSCSLEGHIFAGTYYGLVFRSSDNGSSWTEVFRDHEQLPIRSIAPLSRGRTILSGGNGSYRTSDAGRSWTRFTFAHNDSVAMSMIADSSGSVLAATANGIYRSTDFGAQWIQAFYQPGINLAEIVTTPQNAIMVASVGSRFVTPVLLRSNDRGEHWRTLSTRVSYSVRVNRQGHIFTTNGSVFRSTNDGATWQQLSNGLLSNRLWYLSIDSSENLFVAGYDSVYISSNGGDNWFSSNSGIPYTSIVAMMTHTDGYILLGTWGNGIIRNTYPTQVVEGNDLLPSVLTLEQNYPNPFNPTTTIRFFLPRADHTTLRIFNILGQELTTLFSQDLIPGYHSVEWNASEYSSGIYFYQIQSNSSILTKKLLRIK